MFICVFIQLGFLISPFGSNDYFFVIPTSCRWHLVQSKNQISLLKQAWTDKFCFYFAERRGFEPRKPFWSLHAFQACLFNHSSISPSRIKALFHNRLQNYCFFLIYANIYAFFLIFYAKICLALLFVTSIMCSTEQLYTCASRSAT